VLTAAVERSGLRGWAWRSTKAVGLVPTAWVLGFHGLPAGWGWPDAMPHMGAALGAVMASTLLVLSSGLGRSFQRATWLAPIDADTFVRERFAAECWKRGIEPVDLERTLSAGGDTLRLGFAQSVPPGAERRRLEQAKEATRQAVERFHNGRLWPAHWFDTMESPEMAGTIRLDLALANGEGLLTALQPSAHERMAVFARHTQKAT
jgi:hypothetical protein